MLSTSLTAIKEINERQIIQTWLTHSRCFLASVSQADANGYIFIDLGMLGGNYSFPNDPKIISDVNFTDPRKHGEGLLASNLDAAARDQLMAVQPIRDLDVVSRLLNAGLTSQRTPRMSLLYVMPTASEAWMVSLFEFEI